MPIVFQFVGGGALSSRVIEWFGHSLPVSHVDSVLDNGDLLGARSDSIGGKPPGVQVRPPDYETWTYKLRVSLPASQAVSDKYYAFVKSQIGKPYDSRGLVGAFFIDRDWRAPDSWWCSELNGRGLEVDVSGFLPHRIATPANQLDPMSLLLICSVFVALPGDATSLRKAARLHLTLGPSGPIGPGPL